MPQNIKQQVTKALEAGQSSEEILALISRTKTSKAQALQILEGLGNDAESSISQKIKGFFQSLFCASETEAKAAFWDPIQPFSDKNRFENENLKLQNEYNHLQSGLKKYGRFIVILSLLAGLGAVILLFLNQLLGTLFFGILFIGTLVFFLQISFTVKKGEKKWMSFLLAKKNEWIYNPEEHAEHGKALQKKYPELFHKNLNPLTLRNEIWGNIHENTPLSAFYIGQFQRSILKKKSSSSHQKNQTSHTLIAFPLPKTLRYTFCLQSKTSSQSSTISDSNHLEHFKRYFDYQYTGIKDESFQVLHLLSDQTKSLLLSVQKQWPNFEIFVSKKVFFMLYEGDLWPKSKATNFLKNSELSPKDIYFVEQNLRILYAITQEIPQFLD